VDSSIISKKKATLSEMLKILFPANSFESLYWGVFANGKRHGLD